MIVGTHRDLEETFELHRRGLTRVLRSECRLDDVNDAIEQVLDGSAPAPRLVFDLARVAAVPVAAGAAAAGAVRRRSRRPHRGRPVRRGRPGPGRSGERYLKSELHHYGASVPAVRRIVKGALASGPAMSHDDLVAVVVALWRRPVHECRMAAVELLDLCSDRLVAADIDLVDRMIRQSRTWARVDGLAATVTGGSSSDPVLSTTLDRWAADDDFWVSRSSLLALLLPLRRGEGDFERFSRYADAMLAEREFFIRKAIGWVLARPPRSSPIASTRGSSPAPAQPRASPFGRP